MNADDLRSAALSDHRTGSHALLPILLPDVPGEPYGGIATPAQRAATVQVTRLPLPATSRPADLRDALRTWAQRQPQPEQPNLHGAEVRVFFTSGPAALYTIFSIAGLAEVLDASPGWTAVRISAPLRQGSTELQTLAASLQAQGYAVGTPAPGER